MDSSINDDNVSVVSSFVGTDITEFVTDKLVLKLLSCKQLMMLNFNVVFISSVYALVSLIYLKCILKLENRLE